MRLFLLAAAFFAASLLTAKAEEGPCRPLSHADAGYVVCTFPGGEGLETHLRNGNGEPFGGLSAFVSAMQEAGQEVIFAMNAGMYHSDLAPVGLYVEDGRQETALSTSCGRQNFNMCPNGVFFIADGRARVMETKAFRRARPKADFATQSGPMLVIDGKLHPRFRAASDSYKVRNGVGVRRDGSVVFAISDQSVTFHQFASLFRDVLKTPNALFLDGSISSLHAPSVNRADSFWPVGPIIAVTRPAATQ